MCFRLLTILTLAAAGCGAYRTVKGRPDAATIAQLRATFDDRHVVVQLRPDRPEPRRVAGRARVDASGAGGVDVVGKSTTVALRFEDLEELRTSRRKEAVGWGTLVGGAGGLLVGGLLGYLRYSEQGCSGLIFDCNARSRTMLGALVGGGVGTVAGVLTGLVAGWGPVWRFD